MANIVDIKRQIKSIKNIQQTTKAMELISIVKMRQANEKYLNNIYYFTKVRETMKDIIANKGDINHIYLKHRQMQRSAFVVIASDTGMAGEYNSRVLDYALQTIKQYKDEKTIYTIGETASEYFISHGMNPEKRFLTYAKNLRLRQARTITSYLVNQYNENKIDEINIIYTSHQENRKNKIQMLRLLPILKEDFADVDINETRTTQWDFEPSAKEVFNILAPQYIVGLIYSCIIQSVKCEHEERMEAMNKATTNAKEMLEALELNFHRARQEQITTELIELGSDEK